MNDYLLARYPFHQQWLMHSIDIIQVGICLLFILSVVIMTKYIQMAALPLVLFSAVITLVLLVVLLFSIGFRVFFIRNYYIFITIFILPCSFCLPMTFLFNEQAIPAEYLITIMLFLIFWVYGFLKLGLLRSSQWGFLISMEYLVFMMQLYDTTEAVIFSILIITLINIAGITLSYENEKQARLLLFYDKMQSSS